MLSFKKNSSIENHFNLEFMEKVVAEMPQDFEYVVQEKVHGANTSFLCDGNELRFAKRTSMLADEEKFYEYPELLEAYKDKVLKLFARIKGSHPEVVTISVFGEMFGGFYPHNAVKANRGLSHIQTLQSMSSTASTSTSQMERMAGFFQWMKPTIFLSRKVSSMQRPFSVALLLNV